jgi:hypothetical protein
MVFVCPSSVIRVTVLVDRLDRGDHLPLARLGVAALAALGLRLLVTGPRRSRPQQESAAEPDQGEDSSITHVVPSLGPRGP